MNKLTNLRKTFLSLSILGLVFINIPFLYIAGFKHEVYQEAMSNGLALVFMAEALFLMFLAAFLISRLGYKKPGWKSFIVLSILGSLAFSVPFFLYLYSKNPKGESPSGGNAAR